MPAPDPEQLASGAKFGGWAIGVLTAVVGTYAGTINLLRYLGRRRDREEKMFAAKVDKEMYERHQKANEDHLKGLAKLLEDRRNGERDLFKLIGDNEKVANRRHDDVLKAILGLYREKP